MEIEALVTGSVVRVLVGEGEAVTTGQTLVVLESMKMEIPLPSPGSGVITYVGAVAGASVRQGEVLLRLQP